MGFKVVVREGEPARSALARPDLMVQRSEGRPSHKRRFGYYEKPSALRRKRVKKESIRPGLPLHVYPHSALFARTGPSNSLMR
jgi:ribosomal protein S21